MKTKKYIINNNENNMNFITPEKIKEKSNSYSKSKPQSKSVKDLKKTSKHSFKIIPIEKNVKNHSLRKLLLTNDTKEIYRICEGLNMILSEIISKNKLLLTYSSIIIRQKENIFSLKKKPSISITSYLRRIIMYSRIEMSTLFLSIVYLHKILEKNLFLTDYNVYKLLSISILISLKYNEDKISNNTFYAQVFGISLRDVNSLEYSYLKLLDFCVFIDHQSIKQFFNYLYRRIYTGVNNS